MYYSSRSFNEYVDGDWGRYRIHLAIKLPDQNFNYSTDQVRFFLHNIDEAYYYLNYFRLEVARGNPVLYGLFQKI